MKCDRHPEADAIGGCIRCEHLVCTECKVIWLGRVYCKMCVDELAGIEARLAVQREFLQKKEAELTRKEAELTQKEAELAQKEIDIVQKKSELVQKTIEQAQKENKLNADLEAFKKSVESMKVMQNRDRNRRNVALKCFYHPEYDAIAGCVRCGRFVCTKCETIMEGKVYCRPCVDEMSTSETTQEAWLDEIKTLFGEKPEICEQSERTSLHPSEMDLKDNIDATGV